MIKVGRNSQSQNFKEGGRGEKQTKTKTAPKKKNPRLDAEDGYTGGGGAQVKRKVRSNGMCAAG